MWGTLQAALRGLLGPLFQLCVPSLTFIVKGSCQELPWALEP